MSFVFRCKLLSSFCALTLHKGLRSEHRAVVAINITRRRPKKLTVPATPRLFHGVRFRIGQLLFVLL